MIQHLSRAGLSLKEPKGARGRSLTLAPSVPHYTDEDDAGSAQLLEETDTSLAGLGILNVDRIV